MYAKGIACNFVDWIYSAQVEIILERFRSQQWSLQFHTWWIYFLPAEGWSASQEEFCIMKSATCYVS
jgi:hypothetical protein